jgi:hypothetical protein
MSKKKKPNILKSKILKSLAYTNKLTSYQKFASRVGYMGSGFFNCSTINNRPIFICDRVLFRYSTNLI